MMSPGQNEYLVGTGVYDITGPAGDVVMMGFVNPEQKTSGIHLRLRSRAFIFGDAHKRVVFVSADLGMLFQMVKLKVADKLAADPELSRYYDERNVLLAATHTHGGPGGYSGYFLYDFTGRGFIRRHFETIVDGIYQSIARAHRNLRPGRVYIREGQLDGVGGNRAVEPYENNPPEERALYDGNTDKAFTLLKLVTAAGEEIGMVNWFGVHPDSIGPENTLITSDNKGLAAYLFEKDKRTDYLAERTFVAAFAQGSQGDVTPNIGFGLAPPGVTFETNPSLENATRKQYEKAKELYASAVEPLTGSIDSRHEWVDMRTLYVRSAGETTVAAGMGASFSAGSPLDNPSPVQLFPNGVTVERLRRDKRTAIKKALLSSIFFIPSAGSAGGRYRSLHAEKPVLIPNGIARMRPGGPTMSPQIMPLQILKVGTLAIIAVPAEVTTMSGRRFKRAVLAELASVGVKYAVISGVSNSYASYLATREEYAKQWFEGASTQFGPHQQAGFQQEYVELCRAIVRGEDVPPGPRPEDVTGQTVDLTHRVWFDDIPIGKRFGEVAEPPRDAYAPGEEVRVSFWGGHPSNDYRIQDSFLVVERLENGAFVPVARDWDPEATYRWQREGLACSKITITWITKDAPPGTYRIRHKGNFKRFGRVEAYEGVTDTFRLAPAVTTPSEETPQEKTSTLSGAVGWQ